MKRTFRGTTQTQTGKAKTCFHAEERNCAWDRAPCRRHCPKSPHPAARLAYLIRDAFSLGDWIPVKTRNAVWETIRWMIYVSPIGAHEWRWCQMARALALDLNAHCGMRTDQLQASLGLLIEAAKASKIDLPTICRGIDGDEYAAKYAERRVKQAGDVGTVLTLIAGANYLLPQVSVEIKQALAGFAGLKQRERRDWMRNRVTEISVAHRRLAGNDPLRSLPF